MENEDYTLKDLLSRVVDNRGKTCPTAERGTALIATNCVKNELLYPVFENVRWVDAETMQTWFRGHPCSGDILFVTKGSPGRCCLVPEPVNFCIAQDMLALRADESKVSQKFLFALLRSSIVQNAIGNLHVGTMIPHFKKGDFDQLVLKIPTCRKTQDWIGDLYVRLSAKIELNRRMNETLEGMAQALFKSWFVDFDPVIDNAIAAGNPIPEELADRAEVRRAALANGTANREAAKPFPAAFRHTEELGWIPEGWEVTTFGEHIRFQTGPAFKSKDFSPSGTRLARGDNVKEGRFQWGDKARYWPTLDDSLKKYLLISGDVLLGMDGSKVGKNRVRVRGTDLPCLLVQRVARMSKKSTICNGFIFLVVNSQAFRDYVEVIKTGSAIPHISGGQIKSLPMALPADKRSKIFNVFENIATPIFRSIRFYCGFGKICDEGDRRCRTKNYISRYLG